MKITVKKLRMGILFLFLLLGATGVSTLQSATNVQAATEGFQTINGKTYYYRNGVKYTGGWLIINGGKYYFNTTTGVMTTGWVKYSNGQRRYFYSNGKLALGFSKSSNGILRFFDRTTGYMKTGWQTIDGARYYFNTESGAAATGLVKGDDGKYRYFNTSTKKQVFGWWKNASGKYRYFTSADGIMVTGWVKNTKGYRFFYSNGYMAVGWVTSSNGNKRYFDSAGYMVTGTTTISGTTYTFRANGILLSTDTASNSSSSGSASGRTIKNFLKGALQPVGQCLYIWGGGHDDADATRKGVNPNWAAFYNSQGTSYNYNNYRFSYGKGLDCSGFVGWSVYQIMNSASNGTYCTTVAESVGSMYSGKGWGSIWSQYNLANNGYKFMAGDIGYNSGHTWLVLGQCTDSSLVIIHSTTQAGVQIAGTPTKSGNYSSQAIALAEKYMTKILKKYSSSSKLGMYHLSSGAYITNGSYFRWNTSTLSDPDGYRNMTADQILYNLFGQ